MLAFLWRRGLHRGLFGASRTWTAVFAVTAVVRAVRWLRRREETVVYCEPLGPGESLLIAHRREPTGGGER